MSEPNLHKIDADLRHLTEDMSRWQRSFDTALREQRAETNAYREKQAECLLKLTELTGKLTLSVEKLNGVKDDVERCTVETQEIRHEVDSVKSLIVKLSVGAGGGVAVVSEIVSKLFF